MLSSDPLSMTMTMMMRNKYGKGKVEEILTETIIPEKKIYETIIPEEKLYETIMPEEKLYEKYG